VAAVIEGEIYLRQAAMDARTHALQIGIASHAQAIMPTTVARPRGTAEPGLALTLPAALHDIRLKMIRSPSRGCRGARDRR
jgi:hypothetical protein